MLLKTSFQSETDQSRNSQSFLINTYVLALSLYFFILSKTKRQLVKWLVKTETQQLYHPYNPTFLTSEESGLCSNMLANYDSWFSTCAQKSHFLSFCLESCSESAPSSSVFKPLSLFFQKKNYKEIAPFFFLPCRGGIVLSCFWSETPNRGASTFITALWGLFPLLLGRKPPRRTALFQLLRGMYGIQY